MTVKNISIFKCNGIWIIVTLNMLYASYRQHVDREIGILSATIILALMHSVAGKLEKKVEQINQFF